MTPLLASKSASAAVSSARPGTVPAVVMKVSAPVPASKARRSIPSRRIPVPLESQFRPKLAELSQRDNGIAAWSFHFAALCSFMTINLRAVFMPDQQTDGGVSDGPIPTSDGLTASGAGPVDNQNMTGVLITTSQRLRQKPQQPRRGLGAEPARLAFERVRGPEVPRPRNDDPPHEDAGLIERHQERLRLRGRIDDVVVGAMHEQEARTALVDGGVAHRRGFEIDAPVLHRRCAEIFLGDLV